jgi:cell wall-associated NlpC family hydrolase
MKTLIATLFIALGITSTAAAQTAAAEAMWALPRISVACLRENPGHEAELGTQAIMGMPLHVLEKNKDWWKVETPDGYVAWVIDNSLASKTEAEMQQWRRAKRLVVKAVYQTHGYTSPTAATVRDVVTDLVTNNIVEGELANVVNGRVKVTLPDARTCWVDTADVTTIEQWAEQEFDPEVILNQAYSMEGQPYLWGGTSIKSLDCSGLSQVCYLTNGIIIRRNASAQAKTGTRIEAKDWRTCQAGDLLFFGNAKTGSVTHVAIYDGNGNYVHSSGRVKRNSIDPESADYLPTPFLHAVRIAGNIGSDGITRAKNHPWYF